MFLKGWQYDRSDPGLRVFTLANPLLPDVGTAPDVFEVGCCDTDFLERAHGCGALVTGIDWRHRTPAHLGAYQGNILTVPFGDRDYFDAIISLSAIEHIGLGRYNDDPRDEYGDVKAIQRLRDRLTSKGFIYFDVPYTPEGYGLLDTNKCRCYDDDALRQRFGPHTVLGYTSPNADAWVEKPTQNHPGIRPYWYVALLITQ